MEDKDSTDNHQKGDKVHPFQRANIISRLFFCWAFPLFAKGYRKDLNEDDLYGALRAHESRRLGNKMEASWRREELSENPSLWRALLRVFGKEAALYGLVLAVVELVFKMSQPLLIGKLMSYYTPHQTSVTKGYAYLYASLIVLVSFINVMIMHSYMFGLMHLGMKIRVACCSLIYRKALRLSKSSLAETTVGQMVNLLSNDVNRFDFALIHIHNLWVAPLETIMIVYFLYIYVGPSGITGVGVLLVFIPLQMYLGKKTSVFRLRTALKTDHRVRLMNEIISGIQVIKMYTWEKPFAKLVDKARKLEIQQIRYTSFIRAINVSFVLFLNRTAIFLCVLVYVLTGNVLQAEYVFVVTSFYGVLRQALTMFLPQGVTILAETNVSIKRIQKFLMYDEIESAANPKMAVVKKGTKMNGAYQQNGTSLTKSKPGIHIKEASVKWAPSSPDYVLKDITFNVEPKELVAVVGTVGSGKTTLLHLVLNELAALRGSAETGGVVSYASQEPWLFAGSVKQNILFGQQMDGKKYKEVIRVCALKRDFSLFPYGDRTVVGERGVMLSGGQKARINLARAIYKDADIYLLDDPLSAVDTHVGKQLFDDCISGYLKDKCVVLVTHQLQYLRNVDRIYLFENGSIKASGSYAQLQSSGGGFLELLQSQLGAEDEKEPASAIEKVKSSKSLVVSVDSGPVEVKEQRSSGTISSQVYSRYLRAAGSYCLSFMVFSLFVFAQLGGSGADYFVAFWVNMEQERLEAFRQSKQQKLINDSAMAMIDPILATHSVGREDGSFFNSFNCLYLYSGIIIFLTISTISRSFTFFMLCMRASRNLHNNMFSKIVYTSMRFFNTNPSGRILNRFSKDMGSIDETLPITIIDTVQIGLVTLSITVVIATVNPWMVITTVIILGLFYSYRVVFLATSRDLKRIEATTRSPVFTHITASIQGLTTIRAFGAQNILKMEFDRHQDLHSSAFYMFLGCNRTFGFWLDMNCVVYIGLVTLSFLFIGKESYGGNVGLAITQGIALTGMLQWGMRQWSELENQMTSVERVVEYTEVTPEPEDDTKKPPKSWPSKGTIVFNSLSLRYSSTDPFVLKDLSFKIESNCKVGIVGRTGAGKSSLISALFRLADVEGEILIDGINTKNISLNSLRSKISIIPQEPVLFSGSLRYNLDPFDEYEDSKLWEALAEVELKTVISELPSGLHSTVSEGGSNFSVGQRQLLCLARAVLRNNKVLIMDEATANVDPQTDELIQKTIRRKFADCTVLTIAHRLHTVMDSDKILVMDAGRAVQFDHPHVLLQDTSGILYGLVQQTGRAMAESLMRKAKESYR